MSTHKHTNMHSTMPSSPGITTYSSSSMSHINVKQTRISFNSLPSLTQSVDTLASRSTGDIPLDADSLKVLIIQNDLLCNPCTAIQSLIEFDITYHVIYAFHDNALKSVHPLLYEAIIILGGRHGAYEEMIWLEKEKEFIRKALALDVPILGICLGCQLLAECVGGKVYAGTKGIEIGYKFWKYHNEEPEPEHEYENENEIQKTHTHVQTDTVVFHELKEEEDESVDFNEEDFDDDEEEDDEVKDEEESSIKIPYPSDVDENEDKITLDPFVYALACEDRDQFIILFHGDTFDLPSTCKISKQRVQILASTNKYTSLFRVGKYSYGFQGHPELTYEMLSVWCKCWGDDWLAKWDGNLEKDVIEYARKRKNEIRLTGRAIFDIWCKKVVLVKRKQKFIKSLGSFEMEHINEGPDSPTEYKSGSQ